MNDLKRKAEGLRESLPRRSGTPRQMKGTLLGTLPPIDKQRSQEIPMTQSTQAFPDQKTRSLYLQAADLQFDAILRLDGIAAMMTFLPTAFREGEDPPTKDTLHSFCCLIGLEVETIKKDLEMIVEMFKDR